MNDVDIEYTSIFASFRVVARMHLHEVEDYTERMRLLKARVHCPMLRMAYQMECWRNAVSDSRVLCNPCNLCGRPTERRCRLKGRIPECQYQVCKDCDETRFGCRRCMDFVGTFYGLPECLKAQWIVHAYRWAYGRDNPRDRDLGICPPFYDNKRGSYPQSMFERLAVQYQKGNTYWQELL